MRIESSLGSTQALLEVAIAFCIAYIALERFRYSKIITNILEDSIKLATNTLDSCNANRDTSLTQLRQLRQQVEENKFGILYYSFLFTPRPIYSFDQFCVVILNVVLISLLFYASFFPQCNSLKDMGCVFAFAFLGIAIPTYFIYVGNRNINYTKTKTHRYISLINSTYKHIDPESEYGSVIDRDAIDIQQKADQYKISNTKRLWPNP